MCKKGTMVFFFYLFLFSSIMFAQGLSPKEKLGKLLFFDNNLSDPPRQSCATCHGPEVGYTGPSSLVNNTTIVYPGAVSERYGNRKPPSAAYARKSPVMFHHMRHMKGSLFVCGMFWDGRAAGWGNRTCLI